MGIKPKPEPEQIVSAREAERPVPPPITPKVEIREALDSIPEDLIKDLKQYDSVKATTSKLNNDQQLELMEFIARFASLDEINEYFISNYRINITNSLVYQYKRTKKWQPIINKLREKYLLAQSEVAMSHKRVRLDRREKIYQKAVKKDDLKTALNAVQGSQEEMEERGGININFNQYNSLSDQELEEKKSEILERIKNAKAHNIKSLEDESDGNRGIESEAGESGND